MTRQWRSLAEAERDPAFIDRVGAEFPALREALARPLERRRALKLLAASLALGGLGGCDPGETDGVLIPAVVAPDGIVPGLPNQYASAIVGHGAARGIVVTQQMGRPIKVEGNPAHPGSLGGTDPHMQASILDFYDPDRAAGITYQGRPAGRPALAAALAAQRTKLAATHGAGLRLLTGTVVSPTLARQIEALLTRYPEAEWHQWDGIPRDEPLRGAAIAYGRPVDIVPHVAAADILVAFDSDLLDAAPGHLAHARGFAERRNPTRGTAGPSRLYAVEQTPTLIGAVADHRIVADRTDLHRGILAIAGAVLRREGASGWAGAIAADLMAARGPVLVHAGPDLPAEIHAVVHAMNEVLGGRGRTFTVHETAAFLPLEQGKSIRALAADMLARKVEALVVIGSNPVFTAPRTIGFAEALRRVPFTLALAAEPDETTAATLWSLPAAHEFEHWSDARAHDGTACIVQPQALPLYDGMSPHELLASLQTDERDAELASGLARVQETWRDRLDARGWQAALAAGVIAGTAHPPLDVALKPEAAGAKPAELERGLAVAFRPDPSLWDGRHANNGWLQELPRPLTKLVWDNPLLISPAIAAREGLVNGAEVRLGIGTAEIVAPVFMLPGQAPNTITALLGYGRRVVGGVGGGTGFDMFPIRDQVGPVSLQKTGRQHAIATTDHHNVLQVGPEGVVQHTTLAAFQTQRPAAERPAPPSLYPERRASPTQAWGMSIDLNACIGCNACVVACQAENNIPVVGKEQVLHQREMHWLRIDRYYEGGAEAPEAFFQPMLCMHCEQAPCEVVCPVGATVHDEEGLNVMVYNRCVGTRFCSNNCPYKVRRFNYGAYAREEHRPAISRNPDVTVRARGVMEKCTFCVQRIATARINADRDDRPIGDGEVVTACQAACPTQAFSFGNVADRASEVSRRKQSPLTYALLEEQATRPRTTYEMIIRNPNPGLRS